MPLRPLFASLFLALAALPASAGDRTTLVIHHTNDIHGWIMPRKLSASDPKSPLVGGCATLGSYLKKDEPGDLLLDGGDWFQGTPEGGLTEGRAVMECFNALGYDAAVVGNHEFDLGQDALRRMTGHARFPVLGANVYEEATGKRPAWVTPYLLKEVKGVKVGIFGLVTSNMARLSFPKNIKGLRFRREADEAREIVAKLREEGAQVVIAVTHVGIEGGKGESFEGDKFLAAEVPGIDLIVGGHSHTPLKPSVREPVNGTLIVQAGSYLTRVGKAVLVVDRAKGRVVASKGYLVDLPVAHYGEDEAVLAALRPYREEVGRKLDVVVATTTAALTRDYKAESQLGNWMTDCMRDAAHTDLAFQNSGGIRDAVDQGPLTLREIYQVMPFDNQLVSLRLTGAQVREVLSHGVSGRQGLMQVSGLEAAYELGGEVREIKVAGRPLKDDALYSVATSDFLVSGGDGYKALSAGKGIQPHEVLLRDVLSACARRQGAVKPPAKGRLRALATLGSDPKVAN